MNCPNCHNAVEPGARFCGICGLKLEATDASGRSGEARAPRPGVASAAPSPVVPLDTTLFAPVPPAPAVPSAPGKGGPIPASPPAIPREPAVGATVTLTDDLQPGARFAGPAAAVPPRAAARPREPEPPQAVPDPVAAKVSSAANRSKPSPLAATERAAFPVPARPHVMEGRVMNGRYEVGEKVGEGGFGSVFRGKQLATGREVALKILHPHNVGDATIVARFRREAEACSRLRSPHTVVTYDFDQTEDGILYLVMELLHGSSLHNLQRTQGPLDPDRVLRIIDQVADALGEAHANGIIHRDMKPENIFIETREGEDYVKVLDFGIAKMISGDKSASPQALTAVGQTLGTLEFMSPEQLRGVALDGRSDIYALGIMGYEMLTGELPFKGAKTPVQIINFHMQQQPPAPSQLCPDRHIPPYVDEIILKMVTKAREDRHADTSALRAHIHRALDSRAHAKRHGLPSPAATGSPSLLKDPRVLAAAGAAVALLGVLVYLIARH